MKLAHNIEFIWKSFIWFVFNTIVSEDDVIKDWFYIDDEGKEHRLVDKIDYWKLFMAYYNKKDAKTRSKFFKHYKEDYNEWESDYNYCSRHWVSNDDYVQFLITKEILKLADKQNFYEDESVKMALDELIGVNFYDNIVWDKKKIAKDFNESVENYRKLLNKS